MDALLAGLVIVGGLLFLSTVIVSSRDTTEVSSAGQDLLASMGDIPLYAIDHPWVIARIADGTMNDTSISALEQVGLFWAEGRQDDARILAEILLNDSYPEYGLHLSIEGTDVYDRVSGMQGDDVIAASRMITGIALGEATTGSSASAYLRRITDKRTAAFLTFGGFIGQGNITAVFPYLPPDANITSVTLELDAASNFTLRINGTQCGGQYNVSALNFTPDAWDISACNSSFIAGNETPIEIRFLSGINASYLSGGYIRARYLTDNPAGSAGNGTLRHYLAGIRGIVNLYDALYVPGTLRNMTLRLHYNATANTYVTIGGSRVYDSNLTGERTVELTDQNLTSFPSLLDYDWLSNRTVPLRVASYNSSVQIIFGTNADIILITDKSGSMDWRVNSDQDGTVRSCTNANLYANTTQRLSVAKCLDERFTNITMNESLPNNLNREWLVAFSSSASYYSSNPSQLTRSNLVNQIQNYNNPSGGTCIACAVNMAYNIFSSFSSSNRSRFVVLLTDGIPTHCTTSSTFCNTVGVGTTGTYNPSSCGGDSSDCSTNHCDGPIAAAVNATRRLYATHNATVYTIGFGPVTLQSCSKARYLLETMANTTNGTYYASQNSSALVQIYDDIAHDILSRTVQLSQDVSVEGNVSPSVLYPDSYIDMVYDSSVMAPQQGEIAVTLQSGQFGSCSPTIALPSGVRYLSATLMSYSDRYWTDLVQVNNQSSDNRSSFNLTAFGTVYSTLGDPFEVSIPVVDLVAGNNTFFINTADNPGNTSGCSPNNSLIYDVAVNLSVERSEPVPGSEGCEWDIAFPDGARVNVTIPSSYSGTNRCSYTPSNHTLADGSYDGDDAYQLGAYMMFRRLDFNDDGTIFVNLREEDLEVIVTTISRVPYLHGPSRVVLEVVR